MEKERFLHSIDNYLKGISTPEEEHELLEAIDSSAAYKKLFRKRTANWIPPAKDAEYDRKWEKLRAPITTSPTAPLNPPEGGTITSPLRGDRGGLVVRGAAGLRFVAAAIALLIVGGLAVYWSGNRDTSGTEEWIEVLAVMQDKEFVLPDNSLVYLREGSSLAYSIGKNTKQRRVQLAGEAFFDVQKDAKRPFWVQVDGLTVQVLGTSFSVDRTDKDIATVILVEGKVSLLNNKEEEVAVLTSGQRADYSVVANSCEITDVDSDRMTLWRKGVIVYENVTLEEILDLLSLHFHTGFDAESPIVADERFSGAFLKTQSMETVIDQIEKLTGSKIIPMDTE